MLSEPEVMHIRYSGEVTIEDVAEATSQALGMTRRERPCRFLTPPGNAQANLKFLDYANIPFKWETGGAHRENRLAIVKPASGLSFDILNFFVVNACSRGWSVLALNDRESAVAWLTRK